MQEREVASGFRRRLRTFEEPGSLQSSMGGSATSPTEHAGQSLSRRDLEALELACYVLQLKTCLTKSPSRR